MACEKINPVKFKYMNDCKDDSDHGGMCQHSVEKSLTNKHELHELSNF